MSISLASLVRGRGNNFFVLFCLLRRREFDMGQTCAIQSGVFQRVTRAAVVIALASSIGLHWALFQSFAWVGMLVSYSQQTSVSQAFAITFDGKHPCALCKEITKGKQSEKKSESAPEIKKFEFSYVAPLFTFSSPSHFWTAGMTEFFAACRVSAPPVPPPRCNRTQGSSLI